MQTSSSTVLAHWNFHIINNHISAKELYKAIEEIARSHNYPDFAAFPVFFSEKGFATAKREYLRLQRRQYYFDVCAAPFGNDFFISWWLCEYKDGFVDMFSGIPFIGKIIRWFINNQRTYFQRDIADMFMSSMHSCIMQAIEEKTSTQGERMPELHEKQIQYLQEA